MFSLSVCAHAGIGSGAGAGVSVAMGYILGVAGCRDGVDAPSAPLVAAGSTGTGAATHGGPGGSREAPFVAGRSGDREAELLGHALNQAAEGGIGVALPLEGEGGSDVGGCVAD